MIVLSGADLVLPDRVLAGATLVIDGGRIADIRADSSGSNTPSNFAFGGHVIVPGFVDVHVHGVEGFDTLDEGDAVAAIAARLPRYGVTAFCPTTVACEAPALARFLAQVAGARGAAAPGAARVLPAHLESNFINPAFSGAQPVGCLKSARSATDDWQHGRASDAAAILHEIERAAPDVGIVTLAPEIDGALDLVPWLVTRGHRVSMGHSAASFEEGLAGITAGARHATHLFNRMPPLGHRAPGLAGAVLQSEEVAAEIICDGHHVHPALVRTAVAAKSPARMMAITDGTAVSGLARGSTGRLGGRPIISGEHTATLADGTLAGSIQTMDGAFRMLVEAASLSLVDAAAMCATTPARELGLIGHGLLAVGAVADLVVLDRSLGVVQTYVGGHLAYSRG
jgi:N-acetylglucosamine-6-phosphate deacetylase